MPLSEQDLAILLAALQKQGQLTGQIQGALGGVPGIADSGILAGVPGPDVPKLGTSPIVPTNPDQGIPRDPSLPTPGEGGIAKDASPGFFGKGGAGRDLGLGFLEGILGGASQALFGGGNEISGTEKNLLNARSTLARTQAAGINSQSLQQLLELFIRASGRGGLA